jgi:hypothetical protein
MRTQGEHTRTLRRRVDFLKARDYRNSYDAAELGALEWALVNLPPRASKPWVGLTEDEVFAISNTMPYADRFDFAAAIENKLKEKNEL